MKNRSKKALSLLVAGCVAASGIMPYVGDMRVRAEANLSEGLIGYWKFDGDTDEARLENEVSGTNTEVIKSGSGVVLKSDGGISGGSVSFQKAADSWLKMKRTDLEQGLLNASADDFTFATWVNYDAEASSSGGKMNLFQQMGSGRTILYVNGQRQYGTYLTGTDVVCDTGIVFGKWHHVAVACNHGTKKLQFYINGVLKKESTLSGAFADEATDILIGIHKNMEQSGALKGSLDELRYYNKVVSADTIAALYDEFKLPEEEKEPILITVDPSEEVRDISPAMFGINHRYHNDGYSSWNAAEQKMEEQFTGYAKEAAFGSVRYPGGTVSNLFDWKRAIGPAEQRKKTIHGNTSAPITPNFGVDEAMKWIYDELGSEAVWVYAMGQGSAADAADLFEYLNAPADGDATNPNGGIDWAEVRKENGHEEPYGVTRFEIGNEMGLWGQNYWMPGCGSSSYDRMAQAYVNGGEMTFGQNTKTVQEEDWRNAAANSDGTAGQVRYVRYKPVKEGSVSVNVGGTAWQIVDSLEGRGRENVCTFDYASGKITFGDGTNGNIPAAGQSINAAYTSIQDGFTDYYRELKEIAAELGMEVEVYSCMEKESAIQALKDAGNQYDGAVIHPYSETSGSGGGYINIPENDPEFYEKLLGRSQEHNISRVKELKELMGEGKVPVVSEFGIYRHNMQLVRGIGHAVYLANEMIDYINLGTPYLNKHCLVDYPYASDDLGNGAQCVIQAIRNDDGSYSFVSTPSAKMFSIFNHMTGSKQIGQEIAGNGTYYTFVQNGNWDVPMVKTYATKDDEGNVYVTVVNNHRSEETPVTIGVAGRDLTAQEMEVWYLTSESVEDENTLEHPNQVDVVKTTVSSEGADMEYRLAPHSITSFKIPVEKLAVTARAESGGRAGGSTKAAPGSEVTVTAVPDNGYEFAGWYNGNDRVSKDAAYTFTVTASVELTARFTKKQEAETNPPETEPTLPVEEKFEKGAEKTVGIGRYQVTDEKKKTAKLIRVLNKKASKLNLPATVKIGGATCKVTETGERIMMGNTRLRKVILGPNVAVIGKQAFMGCKNLKNVQLKGKGVKTIRTAAFKKTSAKLTVSVKKMNKKQKKQLLKKLRKAGMSKKAKVK